MAKVLKEDYNSNELYEILLEQLGNEKDLNVIQHCVKNISPDILNKAKCRHIARKLNELIFDGDESRYNIFDLILDIPKIYNILIINYSPYENVISYCCKYDNNLLLKILKKINFCDSNLKEILHYLIECDPNNINIFKHIIDITLKINNNLYDLVHSLEEGANNILCLDDENLNLLYTIVSNKCSLETLNWFYNIFGDYFNINHFIWSYEEDYFMTIAQYIIIVCDGNYNYKIEWMFENFKDRIDFYLRNDNGKNLLDYIIEKWTYK